MKLEAVLLAAAGAAVQCGGPRGLSGADLCLAQCRKVASLVHCQVSIHPQGWLAAFSGNDAIAEQR